MKVSSLQLEAFFYTTKLRSFSKAAMEIGVTQSALSQRISNLEKDLEITLLIRDPGGPVLTPAGEALLRYCQVTNSLEQEVLNQLKSSKTELAGAIRIAAFSSVLRSVIIPSLADFLRNHPKVHCEFRSYEVAELYSVLRNAEADYAILDFQLGKAGIVEHVLGREEYVVIESAKYPSPDNLYLDHGPHDNATESYFSEQTDAPTNFQRSFMGDVYGIINGVEEGLGRAVMSRHLIEKSARVKIRKGYRPYFRKITLNYFEQPYYSRLHTEVVKQLTQNASGNL